MNCPTCNKECKIKNDNIICNNDNNMQHYHFMKSLNSCPSYFIKRSIENFVIDKLNNKDITILKLNISSDTAKYPNKIIKTNISKNLYIKDDIFYLSNDKLNSYLEKIFLLK